MTFEIGSESAQTCASLCGSVDRGWRVEPLPSRVGTRARVPNTVVTRVDQSQEDDRR
jgi:hypothetical protein